MSVVSFATVIWSHHAVALSPMGNRVRCVTRPNNGCKGDYSKCDTDAIYFCSEIVIDNRDN